MDRPVSEKDHNDHHHQVQELTQEEYEGILGVLVMEMVLKVGLKKLISKNSP